MNKAEDLAAKLIIPKQVDDIEELAKKYCEGSSFEDACMEKPAYIAGYHQAERDLELTWKNIRLIDAIASKLLVSHGNLDDEEFYKEVLKQFKDFKEREGK